MFFFNTKKQPLKRKKVFHSFFGFNKYRKLRINVKYGVGRMDSISIGDQNLKNRGKVSEDVKFPYD